MAEQKTAFQAYMEKMKKEENKKAEKNKKESEKIEKKIFEFKVKKLNNILSSQNSNFSFNIRDVGDHYEFDIPISVLLGPKTRKYCANLWAEIMSKADIKMDFTNEVDRVVNSMKDIVVTMKLNHAMTKEAGEGDVKKKGAN